MKGHGRQRQDLQGLRAIAVLLVALNHARISRLSGGYVGVDVFFVLSGFFITGQLLREGFQYAAGGSHQTVSVKDFYARRARRILPAACLTLVVTNIAVFHVYNFVRADQILHDCLAAALFVANLHFAAASTDYFAQAQGVTSPVQHFWSLAVEEQFYLVWPALLAVTFWLVHRLARRGRVVVAERTAWVLLVAIFVGSLAWSVHATRTNPQPTYFSTLARAWELALGAIVALAADRLRGMRWTGALGIVGLGMIVASAFLYTAHTPFPGYAALLPTIGSALIIVASFSARTTGAGRLLSLQPLPFIGDRSYTFYLWHFPVLIIAAEYAGHQLSVATNLLLLTGAFGLSCVTFAFYENPLRFAHWTPQRTAFGLAGVFVALTLSLSVPLHSVRNQQLARVFAAESKRTAALQATAPAATAVQDSSTDVPPAIPAVVTAAAHPGRPVPADLTPAVSALQHDSWFPPSGCMPGTNGVSSNVCRLADTSARRTLVVLGDSHAKMWMPAVIEAAAKERYAVVPLLHLGCLADRLTSSQFNCGRWYRWAIAQARKLRPAATLITFRYGISQGAAKDSATLAGLDHALRALPHPVLIEDPPEQSKQPVECLLQKNVTMGDCTSQVPGRDNRAAAADLVAQDGARVLPTMQWFCTDDGRCPTVINGTAAFQDVDHVSKTYATELGSLFAAQLKRTLRAGRQA